MLPKHLFAALTTVRASSALVLVCLLVAACDTEPDGAGAAAAAGGPTTVVDNPALPPDATPGWTLDFEPEWSVGASVGAETDQLYRVQDAAVLPDGRVAIANAGTGEVRVYDAAGAHVASMGGPGEGPGEFRALRRVHPWAGDSILAWDIRQQRVTVFDREGTHGRTTRIRDFDGTLSPELLGVTADGRLLVRAGFPHQESREPYSGMFRPDVRYALFDADGRAGADLGEHPGEEGFLVSGGGYETFSGHPHAKYTLAAVWGDEILISPNDSFALKAFGLDGRPTRVVRVDRPPRRPTRDDMEAWFDDFTANDTPEERAAFRTTFEAFPLLEAMPAFDALVVDALDHVWVGEYGAAMADGTPTSWIVFDPAGRALGRMRTPPGVEVYEIGADYVLGLVRDDLDVESVQMWPLERGDAPVDPP